MRVQIVRPSELGHAECARWRELQQKDPELASPYFCPEFTQAVGLVRKDVFVAVLDDGGRACGFFPFQRSRLGAGSPVGGPLSDFHGLIVERATQWDAATLMRACRLRSFGFHYLLASQNVFQKGYTEVADSHFMDLSNGFEGYLATLQQRSSHLMKEVRAKRRRLAQDFREVRFVHHSPDFDELRRLLDWKRRQYVRSGLVNVFQFAWTGELLERIHSIQTPWFAGMLSILYFGDEVAAVHMGMRSAEVWNWWFPRHDERYDKYSPGILLRIGAAEAAEGLGIRRIDLGKGGAETYKPRLRSGGIPVAEGRLETEGCITTLHRTRRKAETWIRRSPLLPLVRWPGRILKRMERAARFR